MYRPLFENKAADARNSSVGCKRDSLLAHNYKFHKKTGLCAMMRTTTFTASIIAQMTAKGEVAERGAVPQEKAVDTEKFVADPPAETYLLIRQTIFNCGFY